MKKKGIFLISFLLVISILGFIPVFVKGEEESSSTSIPALYAGTSNPGYIYKYTGGTSWDLISPSLGYAVLCLVEYDGHLYAGTMSTTSPFSGVGKVWRYDGGTTWTLVGDNLDNQVCALAVYNGELYAGTAWDGMKLYKYDGDTTWTQVVPYGLWEGTRALYESHGYLLMGDIGYDRFGRWDGTNFYADANKGGSCIYDYQDFNGYVYGSAYEGRLWQSPDAISWSITLGYNYTRGNIWELEEFQSQLYMSYENGELRRSNVPVGQGALVCKAPDGIISMITDANNLYFGTGGEAGAYYGSSVAGIANVYKYNGISPPEIISGWDQFVGGVQVLYIESRSIDKTLSQTEGELGDTVHITLEVNVPSGENAIVTDYLPEGFRYIKGSFMIDGTLAKPKIKKGVLTYEILDYGSHVLEFDVKIDHAKNWEEIEVCNVASASWYLNGMLVDESEDSEYFSIQPFEELQKSVIGYFTLTQGENTWVIDPIERAETAADFYDYYSVSAHTGFEEPYHSFIYLYRDTISDEVSLFIVHDIDGDVYYPGKGYNSGSPDAQCWMDLSGIPSTAYLAQSDDPGELSYTAGSSTAVGIWHWWYNTDGGAISGLPTTSSWCITIDPLFWYDVDIWAYYCEGDDDIDLDMNQPITICYTPPQSLAIMYKTKVQFAVEIELTNPFSYTMTDTVISDRFGAELMIDYIIAGGSMYEFVYSDYETKNAEVEIFEDGVLINTYDLDKTGVTLGEEPYEFYIFWTGRSQKVHFEWTIDNLGSGDSIGMIVGVSTDTNPAGHQEYTSSGVHELNSGATLKFIDPEQDMQLSAFTDNIYVTVYDV